MAHLKLSPNLRKMISSPPRIPVGNTTVLGAIEELEMKHSGLRGKILDENKKPRRFIKIFVNEEDVSGQDLHSRKLNERDVVHILTALAGG